MPRSIGILFLVWLLAGCNRGPVLVGVRGHVTLDGKPLQDSTITFIPSAHPEFHPRVAAVRDGEFRLDGTEGLAVNTDYEVQIVNLVPLGPMDPERRSIVKGNTIPERYNAKSTLLVRVTDSAREFDFTLTSRED